MNQRIEHSPPSDGSAIPAAPRGTDVCSDGRSTLVAVIGDRDRPRSMTASEHARSEPPTIPVRAIRCSGSRGWSSPTRDLARRSRMRSAHWRCARPAASVRSRSRARSSWSRARWQRAAAIGDVRVDSPRTRASCCTHSVRMRRRTSPRSTSGWPSSATEPQSDPPPLAIDRTRLPPRRGEASCPSVGPPVRSTEGLGDQRGASLRVCARRAHVFTGATAQARISLTTWLVAY